MTIPRWLNPIAYPVTRGLGRQGRIITPAGGGGNGGGGFTPSDLDPETLALRESVSVGGGSDVATWENIGSGVDLIGSTNFEPIYRATGGPDDGGWVEFGAGFKEARMDNDDTAYTGAFTFFFVLRTDSATLSVLWGKGWQVDISISNAVVRVIKDFRQVTDRAADLSDWETVAIICSGASAPYTCTVYVAGVQVGTSFTLPESEPNIGDPENANDTIIGGSQVPLTGLTMIFAKPAAITTDELAQLEAWARANHF